jgi:hypothetical protein
MTPENCPPGVHTLPLHKGNYKRPEVVTFVHFFSGVATLLHVSYQATFQLVVLDTVCFDSPLA